jgi:hypothetical protein
VTVAVLNSITFCAKLGCEACLVPDKDVDLVKWLGVNGSDEAAESEGAEASGDPPAVLADQIGLKAFGVSGKV